MWTASAVFRHGWDALTKEGKIKRDKDGVEAVAELLERLSCS